MTKVNEWYINDVSIFFCRILNKSNSVGRSFNTPALKAGKDQEGI